MFKQVAFVFVTSLFISYALMLSANESRVSVKLATPDKSYPELSAMTAYADALANDKTKLPWQLPSETQIWIRVEGASSLDEYAVRHRIAGSDEYTAIRSGFPSGRSSTWIIVTGEEKSGDIVVQHRRHGKHRRDYKTIAGIPYVLKKKAPAERSSGESIDRTKVVVKTKAPSVERADWLGELRADQQQSQTEPFPWRLASGSEIWLWIKADNPTNVDPNKFSVKHRVAGSDKVATIHAVYQEPIGWVWIAITGDEKAGDVSISPVSKPSAAANAAKTSAPDRIIQSVKYVLADHQRVKILIGPMIMATGLGVQDIYREIEDGHPDLYPVEGFVARKSGDTVNHPSGYKISQKSRERVLVRPLAAVAWRPVPSSSFQLFGGVTVESSPQMKTLGAGLDMGLYSVHIGGVHRRKTQLASDLNVSDNSPTDDDGKPTEIPTEVRGIWGWYFSVGYQLPDAKNIVSVFFK